MDSLHSSLMKSLFYKTRARGEINKSLLCHQKNFSSAVQIFLLSGLSTTRRAVLYLLLITYLSIFMPNHHSDSYMASNQNFLNKYFVKFAWGWTFTAGKILNESLLKCMFDILVLLLVLVTNYMKTSRWVSRDCLTSLMRLGVGSMVWYFWARIVFPYLENLTGNLGTFNSSMTYSSRNTCQECAT